ncbi:MAG: NADH-quinone oxidoreductase subunit L [Hyphomicrobiaceae bacterium]|nr:NADH-quinone oxidoreductase subunit L [Hyphomicrobiaceae bacterium]
MYKAIVFLPLLGACIAGFLGRYITDRGSEAISTALLMISALLSWIVLAQVGFEHQTVKVPIGRWIASGDLEVFWSLRIDTLTAVMLVVVTTVSSVVHLYSIGYMHGDKARSRFFAYLSLFTFAMLMLVTSDNLLQMFFGWEGVGLASYLLIGFWFKKPSANAAAMKAFVVNRVGDFGFAIGIFGIFALTNTLQFDAVFAAVPEFGGLTIKVFDYNIEVTTCICLLIFMGAMGKSAQFLLHTWLPDAMEGPTPVSALIHAATMVTAGVFMVVRLSPLFESSPISLTVVTFVGTFTAFFAATVGLVQNDIKRVIAYSTCSQLGYMFAACGLGAYSVAVFHLFTHAFFKALLFLGAGSVIHAMHHEQDMRNMGGLAPRIRVTWTMMLIGTLALTGVGIPHAIGFAGFYSKDAIIEAAYASHTPFNYVFWTLVASAFMTSFYSWRLIFMTFHGKTRAEPDIFRSAHESPVVMLIPLFILAAGAILSGYIFKDYFIGHHYKEFWGTAIFEGADNHIIHEMHEAVRLIPWVSWMPFVAMLSGAWFAWLYYIRVPSLPAITVKVFKPLYLFFLNKWYFDELYCWIFVRPIRWLGRFLWKIGDGIIIDGLGPNGTAARVLDITNTVVKIQSGFVYHYAFVMMIGVAVITTYFMFTSIDLWSLGRELMR